MKYLPVADFENVTSALSFNLPDCSVTGGCDLYTTKSTGLDKKLYKNIDKDLNSQHAELLKLGASLSPPQKAAMMATSPSLLSQSSAFGPLSELSSRRTFAYLIAILNASHPHYDFSNVLRPGDFKRERNLRRIMGNLDSILQNVRPMGDLSDSLSSSIGSNTSWGPQCWSMIDKQMHLDDCTIFSYQPENDPFEEDESAIWSVHYFFFNRAMKRVTYLYLRVVPVVSSRSPILHPTSPMSKRRRGATLDDLSGAQKRARYWLSDRNADLMETYDEDDDGVGTDGFVWTRGEDGELMPFSDEDYREAGSSSYDRFDDDEDCSDGDITRSPVRGMSEDIAGRMEL